MGESSGQYQKLPPGWDCKYDQATGNCYYINYLTKAMQLEDPRMRYKQLQNERCSTESIPMQPMHGSPYHVYPSNNYPAVRAFQGSTQNQASLNNMSSSPLLSSTKSQMEMSPIPLTKSSAPQTPHRLVNMSRRSTIQETSFSNQINTDAVVNKIQNMFPTAGENHIRLLLRRYYNSEAVVISALQVEKHPVTMPGPFVTPPAQRHLYHSNSAFHMTPPARRPDIATTSRAHGLTGSGGVVGFGGSTSRTASPVPGGRFGSVMSMHSGQYSGVGVGMGMGPGTALYGHLPFHHGSPRFGDQIRSSPKPHSSPKMKLRYMKNIFPKADEMLLLDVLASADNNVQIASEKLIAMGYIKRDFVPPKVNNRPELDVHGRVKKLGDEKIIPLRPKEYNEQEKESMKIRLKEKYNQIAENIIIMALESVNYSEDRAVQILQIVQEEDETREKKATSELEIALNQLNNMTTTDGCIEPTTSDGAAEKIISVALETTMNVDHSNNMDAAAKAEQQPQQKQRLLPSINVTTPSATTTQIILSHPPNHLNESENEMKESHQKSLKNTLSSATTKTLTSSLSSTLSSYQTITTKSILERSNTNETGISGYLQMHGCTPASSNNNKNKNNITITTTITSSNTNTSDSILDKLKLSRSRDKSYSLKNSPRDSTDEDTDLVQNKEFNSLLGRIVTMGHNADLTKGPNDSILLADYVTWNGANPDISVGHKQTAAGSDITLLSERNYLPTGRNPELCKGPKVGITKGSIYAQLKCN